LASPPGSSVEYIRATENQVAYRIAPVGAAATFFVARERVKDGLVETRAGRLKRKNDPSPPRSAHFGRPVERAMTLR
jgi:hypothetical protein